jgi:hypothetical protein
MKIEDLLSIIAPQERPEAKPTGGANFAQHLEEALAADPKATTALKAPSSLGLVTAIDSLTESNRPAEALEMVLSRLDNEEDLQPGADSGGRQPTAPFPGPEPA